MSLVISETRNRSFFTWRGPQVAPCRSLSACWHITAIDALGGRESPFLVTTWIALRTAPGNFSADREDVCEAHSLWSATIEHHLLRSPLHSTMLVVIFFPVPPSTRQAAGPLTENLPNVLTGNRSTVDLSLQRPSPRGTKGRLSSPVLAPAECEGWLWRFLICRCFSCGQPRGS